MLSLTVEVQNGPAAPHRVCRSIVSWAQWVLLCVFTKMESEAPEVKDLPGSEVGLANLLPEGPASGLGGLPTGRRDRRHMGRDVLAPWLGWATGGHKTSPRWHQCSGRSLGGERG